MGVWDGYWLKYQQSFDFFMATISLISPGSLQLQFKFCKFWVIRVPLSCTVFQGILCNPLQSDTVSWYICPLDFCLLRVFTIIPLLWVKLSPLLINEKNVAFLYSHNFFSPRSTNKTPSNIINPHTTLTSFHRAFSCVALGHGVQPCSTQVKSSE